jgi:hypothetical protein
MRILNFSHEFYTKHISWCSAVSYYTGPTVRCETTLSILRARYHRRPFPVLGSYERGGVTRVRVVIPFRCMQNDLTTRYTALTIWPCRLLQAYSRLR